MLKDKFGRRFRYLRLSVTDVCNFRCQYCLPDGYQCEHDRKFLSLDEIKSAVRAFAHLGTTKVRITGGEPALRKDLNEIIASCRQQPSIEQVALTTNGFNLKHNVREWHQQGLTNLNVSVDSFDPKQFKLITGHNKLESILSGIDLALDLGLKVKVNMVLLRDKNTQELSQFIAWVKDKPVTLRFIELMQTGDNLLFFKQNHLSGEAIKSQLIEQGWQRIERDLAAGPAQEFSHPDYRGNIGLIMPYSKDFCASCNRLRLTALGKLHLCLFAEQGLDLRHLLNENSQQMLQATLHNLIQQKDVSHWLHQGQTGATQHLAMLGG